MAMRRKETAPAQTEQTPSTTTVETATAAEVQAPVETAAATTAAPATPEPEVVQEPAAETPKVDPKPAQVPATTQKAAAPVVAGRVEMKGLVLEEKRDLLVMPYGTLPRLKATNGNFMDGDDKVLGDTIKGQVMSWNEIYVIGPCDNKAPSELVKYSYDGINLSDDTGTVKEWVANLKGEWPDAASKMYYEVVIALMASAKPCEHVGELVQLQLSPTSVSEFKAYQVQTSFKMAQRLLPESVNPDVVEITAVPVSAKGNNWTKAKFKVAVG